MFICIIFKLFIYLAGPGLSYGHGIFNLYAARGGFFQLQHINS